ncbi:MAG TPA: lysophospholipid acyltransferase family protein [Chloroflexota bacterium]|nr:lysophospholipid acyltransferase family protein [Chloroflexota bacterium]
MINFYDFASVSTHAIARLLSHVEVQGLENLPRTGPLILAPNHLHIADPPVLSAFLPRKIYFMAKQEAWGHSFMGLLSRWFEAFPVRRGEADLAAYRYALKLLADGKVLGIFPEGHRSRDGHLQPGQPGAVILAQRAGAPIVPVGIHGVSEVLSRSGVIHRRTLSITVGEPYHPPRVRRDQIPVLTADLMARIAALLPPEVGVADPNARPPASDPRPLMPDS